MRRSEPDEVNTGRPARWAASIWVRLPVLVVLLLVVGAVTNVINGVADATPLTALVSGLVTAGLALAAYVGLVRYLEGRRRPRELELARARPELLRGAALGAGLFTATIGLVALFGGYQVDGWGSFGGALTATGLMICVATTEELVFRGGLFRVLEERTGTYWALAVSGLAFGALHLVNEDATVWGALALAVEAGLLLGAAYAATRTLWLPIGLHLAWNASSVGVFGTVSSGAEVDTGSLLESTAAGSPVVSGGAFGPEASVLAILVCAVPTVLFLRAAKRHGRIRPRAGTGHARTRTP